MFATTQANQTKDDAPPAGRASVPPALIAIVLTVLVGELTMAWLTYGTPDITIWTSFAQTADRVGPIEMYSLERAGLMVYNHPPLIGWWLQVVNAATDAGIPFGFMIRLPSVLAHAATALLVFAILQRRVTQRVALASALLVAASPVLVIISGFHGNNDPVVAMLVIAAVYLLVDRRWPVAAGAAFALALSIKIVPVITLPLLLFAAWRLGRRDLLRFVAGALPVLVLLWVPVLVMAGPGFIDNVIFYNGSGFPRQWGPFKFAEWLNAPGWLLAKYSGTGTYLVVAVSALLPLLIIRRRPDRTPAALGLCLGLFLLISPGWAPQYTSWIAAAVFFVEFWTAVVFTVGAGAAYLVLYTQWNGNTWWNFGEVTTLTRGQVPILGLAWLSLVPSVVTGVLLAFRHDQVGSPTLWDKPGVGPLSRDTRREPVENAPEG